MLEDLGDGLNLPLEIDRLLANHLGYILGKFDNNISIFDYLAVILQQGQFIPWISEHSEHRILGLPPSF